MGKRAVNRVANKIYEAVINDLQERATEQLEAGNESAFQEMVNKTIGLIENILEEEERQGYLSWQAKSEMSESEDSSAGGDTAVDSV